MTIYRCNFCAKIFKSLLSLKRHVCNIDGCSEKLNNKISLRKHVHRKHKGKIWNVPKTWYTMVLVSELEDGLTDSATLSSSIAGASHVRSDICSTPVISFQNVSSNECDNKLSSRSVQFCHLQPSVN